MSIPADLSNLDLSHLSPEDRVVMEEYLRRAMTISRGDATVFFTRPLSATLLALAAVVVAALGIVVALPILFVILQSIFPYLAEGSLREPFGEVVRALGWPILMIEGIEADDVIGTLAAQAAAQGLRTIISTGDKDLAQLVNDKVTLVNTMSNETLDRDGVIAKFGVPPERIVDYLTLVGDTVDNVPGVEKVGPKTAVKWLAQYATLDGVIANAAQIGGVVGKIGRAHV